MRLMRLISVSMTRALTLKVCAKWPGRIPRWTKQTELYQLEGKALALSWSPRSESTCIGNGSSFERDTDFFLEALLWYVMCACASDRQGRKGLRFRVRGKGIGSQVWSRSHFWVPGVGSGDLRSRLEEPPVGREGETALEPSGRWEREPMLYLPSAI